jgi:hypothetical protein
VAANVRTATATARRITQYLLALEPIVLCLSVLAKW